MSDLIVFYEQDTLTAVEQSDEDLGVLVFHVPGGYVATDQPASDNTLILTEQPGLTSQESPLLADLLLLTTPSPTQTVDYYTGGEVLQIVSGGPRGEMGPVGPPGPASPDYEQTFNFPAPSLLWTLTHNQNTKALSVNTFDTNGDVVIGGVDYPDNNTITIEWFYPMSGSATVFD